MERYTVTVNRTPVHFTVVPKIVIGRDPQDTVLLVTAPNMTPVIADNLDAARNIVRLVHKAWVQR